MNDNATTLTTTDQYHDDVVRDAERDAIVALVQAEEELDGDMPGPVKLAAVHDPEEFLRMVVRATKKSILRRIAANEHRRKA